jgi:hypothetical protein
MVDSSNILAVLEALGKAYPRQVLPKQSAEVYIRFLEDIPIDLLWQVAERHIATSTYFPRIAELRTLAAQLGNTKSYYSLENPAASADNLAYQAQLLEDDFYRDRILEPAAWMALAEQFERANRPHRAEYTRRKLAGLLDILEQELAKEEQLIQDEAVE